MGWADGLADGLATGVALGNSIQRTRAVQQEQDWKAEDRQRETDERKQLDEAGKIFGKWEQGDYSPAVAKANSSGMFGPDRFATGARRGEDGNIYANLYDAKNPVDSLQEVNLGKEGDLKNQMVMANLPPSVLAKVAAAQAQKQSDPAYQQQLESGNLGIQKQRADLGFLPTKQALDLNQGQAALAHTNASTANLQQGMQQSALMGPAKIRETEAEAALKERLAANPYSGLRPAGYITQGDPDSEEGAVKIPIYDPNDPRLQVGGRATALGKGSPASPPAAQQPAPSAAPAAKSATPAVDAKSYYQGLLQQGVGRDMARTMTTQKFGGK